MSYGTSLCQMTMLPDLNKLETTGSDDVAAFMIL